MSKLLTMIQDGEGNTSSMRVLLLLVTLAVIVPKVYIAIKTGVAPVWTGDDMAMIGVAMSGKIVQNQQENNPTKPTV